MLTLCRRVLSHVKSTALNGSINWPWSAAVINNVRAWEAKILRFTFKPRMKPGETWVGYRKKTAQSLRTSWRKMCLPLLTEKMRIKSGPGVSARVCPDTARSSFHSGVENDCVVEKPDLLGHGVGPDSLSHVGSIKLGSTTEECSGTHRWQSGPANGMIG